MELDANVQPGVHGLSQRRGSWHPRRGFSFSYTFLPKRSTLSTFETGAQAPTTLSDSASLLVRPWPGTRGLSEDGRKIWEWRTLAAPRACKAANLFAVGVHVSLRVFSYVGAMTFGMQGCGSAEVRR